MIELETVKPSKFYQLLLEEEDADQDSADAPIDSPKQGSDVSRQFCIVLHRSAEHDPTHTLSTCMPVCRSQFRMLRPMRRSRQLSKQQLQNLTPKQGQRTSRTSSSVSCTRSPWSKSLS